MSKKSGKRRGGGGTIVASIISALIGAAATVVAAVILARFSPGTVIQFVDGVGGNTDSNACSRGSSGPVPVDSANSQSEWLVEVDPITREGVWTVEQAEVAGSNYTHSWIGSTGSGDDTSTSWVEFGIPEDKTQLSGLVGVQNGGDKKNKAQFVIEVDGQEVFDTQKEIGEEAEPFRVEIAGADNLRLQVTDTSGTQYSADGVFADIEMK